MSVENLEYERTYKVIEEMTPFAPVHYKKASNRSGVLRNSAKLITSFPQTVTYFLEDDDISSISQIYETHESNQHWIHLGFAPRPKNYLSRARHHFGHGLAMGYPVVDVIVFVIRDALYYLRRSSRTPEQ